MPKSAALRDRELAFVTAKILLVKQRYVERRNALRREYKEAIREWERVARGLRNESISQLERLADYESIARSTSAEETVLDMLVGPESASDSVELKRLRKAWCAPTTSEEHVAVARIFDRWSLLETWPTIAQECGVSYPVTFNKQEVTHILDYSLAGVDKLRRKGVLLSQRTGHRTLTFLPADVRKFITDSQGECPVFAPKRKRKRP